MSQAKLAAKAGLSPSIIHKYSHDLAEPSYSNHRLIAKALGVWDLFLQDKFENRDAFFEAVKNFDEWRMEHDETVKSGLKARAIENLKIFIGEPDDPFAAAIADGEPNTGFVPPFSKVPRVTTSIEISKRDRLLLDMYHSLPETEREAVDKILFNPDRIASAWVKRHEHREPTKTEDGGPSQEQPEED